MDKQGRILIPGNLREFAALDKDVVLVGVGKKIEIWDKVRYEASATDEDIEEISEQMLQLGYGI